MKTYIPKADEIVKTWYVVDLDGAVLGRAAGKVAEVLRGKNKPQFTPHLDTGDFVIAVNASKLKVSGTKADDKFYYHYSGYPGGLRARNFKDMMAKDAAEVFRKAVKGMLPKNRLGRQLIKKLHVYADAAHMHQAQQPQEMKLS